MERGSNNFIEKVSFQGVQAYAALSWNMSKKQVNV
jgi:hypothetical protein